MNILNYERTEVPSDYKCGKCGAQGCKLWRETSLCQINLLCVDCACTDQKKVNNVDDNGLRTEERRQTDQIGWYVPAIPTPDNNDYWVYGSNCDDACAWWVRLPLRPVKPA